ncbi:MAG: MauE/DoxX family redox-associated membrane protein [Syntrophobacteraceae bacterium]|nr:MauE/DoxX family redox-associated membrane protein [Syntrophobacteraceae bacterium]
MIRGPIKLAITSQYLSFALRVLLGSSFIYASLGKITHPAQFAQAVANYRIVPYMFLNLGAVILPWIELITGLFLIIRFKSHASVIVIGLLLVMFEVMILINMYRGTPISCGCFDSVGEQIGWKKVFEDALMLAFVVQIYYFDRLELMEKLKSTMGGGGRLTTTGPSPVRRGERKKTVTR